MEPQEREMPNTELKSCFPSTFTYQPWLIQLDPSNESGQMFIDPFSAKTTIKKIKALDNKVCLGSYQEWLLLLKVPTKETFLLSSISGTKVSLPAMSEPLKYLGGFILTSEPNTPKCTIVFACKGQRCILYCQPNGPQWIKVPFPELNTRLLGQIVICNNKLYILARRYYNCIQILTTDIESLQTGVIEYTIIEGPVGDNYVASLIHDYSDHVVVSGENILLVLFQLTFREVARVEAYRLDETSNVYWQDRFQRNTNWMKIEIIDRHIFFLSTDCNVSFVPKLEDMQSNCTYILRSEHHGLKLHKINWDNQTISSLLLPKTVSTEWNRICWVAPSRSCTSKGKSSIYQNDCMSADQHLYVSERTTKKPKTITCNISRSWADLPIELVELLLPHLGLVDCLRLRSVCKAWSSLSNPFLKARIWPWLLYFTNDYNNCRLFDPIYSKEYSLDMEWLTSGKKCTLHFSKHGWVLLSVENDTYVVNPFTRESIRLPHNKFADPCSFTFYSLPTSDDFMVFGIWGLYSSYLEGIYMWWPGEEKWITTIVPEGEYDLPIGWCNPVVCDGIFYSLGRNGDLGAINPYNEDKWEFFETPVHNETPTIVTEDCYLLELDGELISVFRERTKQEVRIFMLDHDEWAWNKQEDSGDLTLFLDQRGSVAKKFMLGREYANRIYFSGFDIDSIHKVGAYYSIDSRSYHPRFVNLQKPMNCVWLEPNLRVNNNTTNP